jgi:hypothetical protein
LLLKTKESCKNILKHICYLRAKKNKAINAQHFRLAKALHLAELRKRGPAAMSEKIIYNLTGFCGDPQARFFDIYSI